VKTLDAAARRDLLPSSAIPIAYFGLAHLGLAAALLALVLRPDVPGAFFYQPRMVALVHLVTLTWLSGSILGAFYIVAPLALRLPMPVRWPDWTGFASFAIGTTCMVVHFWIGDYNSVALGAGLVTAAIGWVALRAWRGLPGCSAPWPVTLHVALAFGNILAAAAFGILIALDRSQGFLGVSPLSATMAHAHLAAIGWAVMMVVGLSYRLIPMMLPAAMPTGPSPALSAILIEGGLAIVVVSLVRESAWLPLGACTIAAGLGCFVFQIQRTVKRRVPRPPALPRRDWSLWQTHMAILWLFAATVLGIGLSVGVPQGWRIGLTWIYGVAGLVGFLTQIVVGMQGRLVPLYAWYRAYDPDGGVPAKRAANALPSEPFARIIFLAWALGVPSLAWGLAGQNQPVIAAAAALLFGGVCTGAAYLAHMIRAAGMPAASPAVRVLMDPRRRPKDFA